ncbi:MAG TPA: hypothetical protein VJR89_42875 [Polyangiales bacterium]|nr:hypothetical protein [Polyangiales bacterium]
MTQWIVIGSFLISLAAAVGCSDSKEPDADETSGGEKVEEAGDAVGDAAEDTADAVDEAAEDATH